MAIKYLICLFIFLSQKVFASACCAGGAALPNIITGDYKSQFTAALASSTTTHDALVNGEITKRDGTLVQLSETFTIKNAWAINSLWQFSFSLPFKKNTYSTNTTNESSNGISDLNAQISYEFMPQYEYGPAPRGFIYFSHEYPLSESIYSSEKPLASDGLSRGYQQSATGISFFKRFPSFQYTTNFELHKGHKKVIKTLEIDPGFGQTLSLSTSFFPKSLPVILTAGGLYFHEASKKVQGEISSTSAEVEYTQLTLGISYSVDEHTAISGAYTDQSFFGKAKNTSLSQSLALSYTRFVDL